MMGIFRALWMTLLAGLMGLSPSVAANAAESVSLTLVKTSKTVFSRPHDLILSPDRRYLLVADNGNDAVKVLDPQSLKVLAVIGQGELSAPHDVAFDGRGRLLVADTGNDRIAVYSFDGIGPGGAVKAKLVESWDKDMGSPEGVAADGRGRVYVTNAGLDTVLALEKGRIVKRAGGRGRGENQYIRPHDIHVDGQGRILVVDPGNNRIQILDRDLGFRSMLAGKAYGFYEPKYVTHDKDGMVYVADEYNNRVLVLDPSHTPVGVYGGVRGTGPGQLNKPEGVEAAGPKLWVSDTYNDRILLLKRP